MSIPITLILCKIPPPYTDLVEEIEDSDEQATQDEHEVGDNDDQATLEYESTEQLDMNTPVDENDLKVVMVKRKTLWWPGQMIKETNEQTEVQLLNQQKTMLTVSNANVKPFAVDHGQMQGMKRDWRDAYMKAVKLVQK